MDKKQIRKNGEFEEKLDWLFGCLIDWLVGWLKRMNYPIREVTNII